MAPFCLKNLLGAYNFYYTTKNHVSQKKYKINSVNVIIFLKIVYLKLRSSAQASKRAGRISSEVRLERSDRKEPEVQIYNF